MYKILETELGEEHVLYEFEAQKLFPCPSQSATRIKCVVRPGSTQDIQTIVHWANENKIALYPISTGKNWGYGGGNPVEPESVIVDLGRLNMIKDMDFKLGLVTVEPGVSQGALYTYLQDHNAPFYVPVTGSSPDCSLIGNALERGYGVTPMTDHFYAIQTLTAIMPDGTLYQGLLSDIPHSKAAHYTKWGVGPYTDGLFSQGNFGIVVSVTFKLIRKASHHTLLMLEPKTGCFSEMVDCAKSLMETHQGTIQSVKFFNQYYSVALNEAYPYERAKDPDFSADKWVEDKARALGFSEWMGIIFIYGSKSVTAATLQDCKEEIAPYTQKIKTIGKPLISALRHIVPYVPNIAPLKALKKQAETLISAYHLMQGQPQEKFLQAAYWRAGKHPKAGKKWNPGRDGCGLIWFAPFLPFTGADIEKFQALTIKVCAAHDIFPIFSMTTLSTQGISALLPITFDPATEIDRAHACHKALFDACKEEGYLPYRAHLDSMAWFTQAPHDSFWNTVQSLKQEIDPHSIMAPGRYDGHHRKALQNEQ